MNTSTSDPYASPGWAPYASPPTHPPASSGPPWWQRDGVVSRILVLAGVGVTLIGVVMLLVVAAQNGLLGPQVRVAGGALLAAALIGTGWRIMDRPGGRIGGIALQATGFAGLFLDILAMTTFYDWVPPVVGLVGAFGVTAAGVIAALRWNTQSLAVIVNLCCALLAPALTLGVDRTLVGFLLVFAVAGAVPEIQRGWTMLAPVRTLPVVLTTAVFYVIAGESGRALTAYDFAITLGILLVGLASGLIAMARRPKDLVTLATMAASTLPAFGMGSLFDTWTSTGWYLALTAVLLAPVAVQRALPQPTKFTLIGLSVMSALCATTVVTVAFESALPFLVLAVVFFAADLTQHSTTATLAGHVSLVVGGLLLLMSADPGQLSSVVAAQSIPASAALSAWVALVATVLGTMTTVRLVQDAAELRPFLVGMDAALALYAISAGFIATGVQILDGSAGFSLGQFLATAAWMTAAFGLLNFGLHRPEHARLALTTGLALVAAALAKLFLFDLAALNGLGRGGAFLVVGLLLLATGTRYARVFAERAATRTPESSGSGLPPHVPVGG